MSPVRQDATSTTSLSLPLLSSLLSLPLFSLDWASRPVVGRSSPGRGGPTAGRDVAAAAGTRTFFFTGILLKLPTQRKVPDLRARRERRGGGDGVDAHAAIIRHGRTRNDVPASRRGIRRRAPTRRRARRARGRARRAHRGTARRWSRPSLAACACTAGAASPWSATKPLIRALRQSGGSGAPASSSPVPFYELRWSALKRMERRWSPAAATPASCAVVPLRLAAPPPSPHSLLIDMVSGNEQEEI